MKGLYNRRTALVALTLILALLLPLAAPGLAETFSAIVTSKQMTVYREAAMESAIDTLPRGMVVRVQAYSGRTALITYEDMEGYALVSDMKSVDSVSAKALSGSGAKVYQSPDKKSKSVSLAEGERLYVLETSGDWAKVEKDGAVGFMPESSLVKANGDWSTGAPTPTPGPTPTPAPIGQASVTAKSLKVYEKESASSQKLGKLQKGQIVTVLSWGDPWAHIELEGHRGYAPVSGLSMLDGEVVVSNAAPTPTPSIDGAAKGTVSASSLPVYKTASSKSQKLATLESGAAVNVIKWNSTWAFIEADGLYGFCDVTGLSRKSAAAPTPTPALSSAVEATVTGDRVNVYETASTGGGLLGTLEWGETVNVLSVSGGWAYIEKEGHYGFCPASALSQDASVTVTAPTDYVKADFTATVIDPAAVAYEKASTSASKVSVPLGQELDIAAYSKDLKWACVALNGKKAFMLISQLNRGKYETVSGTGEAAQNLLRALQTLGYYDGPASASAGSELAAMAVRRFQAACELPETGEADRTVQRILYGGHAPESDMLTMSLSLGSKGDNVTRLQTRLYVLGYLGKATSLDGDYGATTAAAVGLFQQANGIGATGSADGATLRAMYAPGASGKPSSVKPADDPESVVMELSEGTVSRGGVVTPPSKVTLSGTYVTTMPASLKSTTSSYSSGMSNPQRIEHAIYSAQAKLGCTYVFGATGPNTFDCSGLTQYSYKKAGVSLKRSAYSQGYDSSYSKISGVSNLKRGDLVFFNTISDSDLSDHVGIYLGGGCFIHASSGGHKVVVSNLASGFYNRVFSWGRRILP